MPPIGPKMQKGNFYSKKRFKVVKKGPKKVYTTRKGLMSKTAIQQTRKIAKQVLLNNAESKYFDVKTISQLSGIGQAGILPTPARLTYPQMYVLGFASGENTVGGNALSYGQTNIVSINHGRIHAAGNAQGQEIEGQYVSPMLSSSMFDIQRVVFNSDLSNELARNSMPFLVRVLRLCPRPAKGSNQAVDPERDAFLTAANQEIGVSDLTFQHYDLLMNKPNTKKYMVKQDFRFLLEPPVTSTEVAGSGSPAVASYAAANISTRCHKQMTFRHDIGKKLFYENPLQRSTPTDGFKNEYVLIHIVPTGAENVGTILPSTCRVAVKAVGTFKDL